MNVIHAGIFADHELGGDVVFRAGFDALSLKYRSFDYRARATEVGQQEMNSELVSLAKNADLLFIGKGELIWPETLARISRDGTSVALWYGDVREQPEPWLVELLPHCDAYFSTSGGRRFEEVVSCGSPGNACFFFNPCNLALMKTWSARTRSPTGRPLMTASRYGFAGEERQAVFRYIDRSPQIDLVGSCRRRFANPLLQRIAKRFDRPRRLRGSDYIAAIRNCCVGIAVSAFQDEYLYCSDRVTHYLQFGAALIHWRFPGCERLLADREETVFVESIEELEREISILCDDSERASNIGRRAAARVARDYSVPLTLRRMLDFLDGNFSSTPDWYPRFVRQTSKA
ncbi:MAG: glycosyltransferase [Planctomycetota bacterium]